MGSEKPNFRSQPVVKNVFMFRNGDPYYEARRIVINQKRVSNFETLLREVTGGIQAPFGALPTDWHKKEEDDANSSNARMRLASLTAERYFTGETGLCQCSSRAFAHYACMPLCVSSFRSVVANGDVLNPAMRLLIHQRLLGQFERILEMITEKMGLKVLGGVRSLYTYEGHQVTDGNQLESGQLYVAVGRERFKKLPYSDLLFTKPRGTRRVNGMKAYSLPPIYRFSKQNGNSKSVVRSSDSGGSKASPPAHNGSSREHLASIVREISQARLLSLRKKESGQSMTLGVADSGNSENRQNSKERKGKSFYLLIPNLPEKHGVIGSQRSGDKTTAPISVVCLWLRIYVFSVRTQCSYHLCRVIHNSTEVFSGVIFPLGNPALAGYEMMWIRGADDGNAEDKTPQDQPAEEKPADGETKAAEEDGEKAEEREEAAAEETTEEDSSADKEENKENQETNGEEEGGEEKRESDEQGDEKEGDAPPGSEEKVEEVKSEEQGAGDDSGDKTQDGKEKEDGSHASPEGEEHEQDKNIDEEKRDEDSGKGENNSEEQVNDVDTGEEEKGTENADDPGKTQPDNETKENHNGRSSSSGGSDQEDDGSETKEGAAKEAGEE
ncbi:hypothetical protein L3Q82_013062 [Scortum barcoo]|uniref:Uncharacterized protein n=1 Tax=Scortum barcoo TaxID=214431 RepID=A0ACB8VZC1_9TELE|nr:hypothetical protein L3Q82_013062 [Scortum barcoo]